MICFKDMTFCSRSPLLGGDCANRACSRNYTDVLDEQNVDDLPLSVGDMKEEKCGYQKMVDCSREELREVQLDEDDAEGTGAGDRQQGSSSQGESTA